MGMFAPATRRGIKARLLLIGPTGWGKTYTALRVAAGLGSRIAYCDTENRSAEKYVGDKNPDGGLFAFDVCNLGSDQRAPEDFIRVIDEAERGGYDVLVIDSISHAWAGTLAEVDKKSAASRSGSSFEGWRTVTPRHNALVERLVGAKVHLICCVRSKMEYVIEEDSRGKKVPRKVGMAPVFRDGIEYEFDIALEAVEPGTFVVAKTRASALFERTIVRPGAPLAHEIRVWLESGGAPQAATKQEPAPAPPRTTWDDAADELREVARQRSPEAQAWVAQVIGERRPEAYLRKQIGVIRAKIAREQQAAQEAAAEREPGDESEEVTDVAGR